jgi:hypothetical protein
MTKASVLLVLSSIETKSADAACIADFAIFPMIPWRKSGRNLAKGSASDIANG